MSSYQDKFESLGKALDRYNEALVAYDRDKTDLMRDAVFKRFEFTFELFWKVLKAYLINEGYDVRSPREVLQKAYGEGLLGEEQLWLAMLKDRNLASHLYNEGLANETIHHLQSYYPALRDVYQHLKSPK